MRFDTRAGRYSYNRGTDGRTANKFMCNKFLMSRNTYSCYFLLTKSLRRERRNESLEKIEPLRK